MASIGEAAARGLEGGFNMGLRARASQRQEEEDTRRRQREDTVFQQQQDDRARKLEIDDEERQLKALTDQLEGLRAEGEGVAPHCVQIAGREPYWMGEAARLMAHCLQNKAP